MLPYILNLIRNEKVRLTLILLDFNKFNDLTFQWKKNDILWLTRWNAMTLKIEREIAANNGMWLTHPSHVNVNKKKNSDSVLTGRKCTKIVKPRDNCLNQETPNKSGRLCGQAKWLDVCTVSTRSWVGICIYIYPCGITIVHKRELSYHIYRWKEQNNYAGRLSGRTFELKRWHF